jgi:hypothetical protein
VVLLAAAGLGWVIWTAVSHGRPLVHSALISFTAQGQHSAKARFSVVRRDEQVKASCLLRATAADHSIVGELNFTVGAANPATVTLEKSIRTERRASSVDLIGCTADGQKEPR